VNRNDVEAFVWQKKAADQGLAEAQMCMGCLYSDGIGVTRNLSEAFLWYKKAADQGCVQVQNQLGMMFA